MLRVRTLVGLVLLVLGVLLGFDVYRDHQRTAALEQQRLVSLAAALNVNIGQQLRASASMLDGLRLDAPVLLSERQGIARLSHRMALLSESVVGVRSLLWVGPDGQVLASNRPELMGHNFKNTERYQTIKAGHDADVLYVSAPFDTPLGLFTISLGKVVLDAQGRFDGYVLAILNPDYFGVLMRSLLYATDMRISVAHGDGRVIFSTQDDPDIRGLDLTAKANSLFNAHVASERMASFMTDGTTASDELRLVAIHTVLPSVGVADKALVVAVSREADAVFAEWRRQAWLQAGLFVGILVAVSAGYAVYHRRTLDYQQLSLEKTQGEARAEARLRETADLANKAKMLFLGNMSHEMRTPLHQISGVVSLFRHDTLSEKQLKRIGMLETAVKRLDTVIGGILTLVDIEAGVMKVKLVPVVMEELVTGVVSMVADRAVNKYISFDLDVAPLPPNLLGDANHLTTILSCLCNNAITYSEQGVIAVRVQLLREDAGSVKIRLEVQDQGIGIAPEHMPRLFQHFEQVDNSDTRRYGGTGVGLAIVKQLAQQMGGDVGCESTLGQGSTFWVSLRLVKRFGDGIAEPLAV